MFGQLSRSILLIAVACLGAACASGCASLKSAPVSERPLPVALASAEQELAKMTVPSNTRAWSSDQALLPAATFEQGQVHVENIRNCHYFDADTYVLKYYDRTITLSEVQTVDFLVMPFQSNPLLAHTMLSFGLADGTYLGVSVEIRKEQGETYHPVSGFFNKYEMMYVIGDEKDLIALTTNHRATDVYLYRTRAQPVQAQAMFIDILQRANKLRIQPEFYNTITNNCTTNLAQHVNALAPGKVPYSLGVILPGLADRAAYDLGLLDTELPFEEAKQQAYVTKIAQKYADSPDFSRLIRLR